MNLSELLQSAIGESFDVTLPESARQLSKAGKKEIWNALYSAGVVRYDPATYSHNLYEYDLWAGVGSEFVTKSGKVTRRISRYLYEIGIKIDDMMILQTNNKGEERSVSLVSHLGNIAHKYLTAASAPYHVSFVTELWSEGEYGDSGACFHPGGQNEHIPDCIFAAAGAGVTVDRIVDNRLHPFGRAWVSPSDSESAIALYNWYQFDDGWNVQTLGDLLANGVGSPFAGAQCEEYPLKSDSGMYFNTSGCVLYAPDWEKPRRYVYVPIEIVRFNTCADCGDRLYDGDDYEIHGDHYCENCYPGRECDFCHTDCLEDDLQEVADGSLVCGYCLRHNFTECEKCGSYHPDGDMRTVDLEHSELSVCESCYDDFHSCDFCANGKGNITVEGDKHACVTCYATDYHLIAIAPHPVYQLYLENVLYSWQSYNARRADLIVYNRAGWQFYAA